MSDWDRPEENSIEGLLHGMEFADGVEFDLRVDGDGEFVIFHDEFVPGPGPISPPRDTYYGTSTYTARTPFTYARGSCVVGPSSGSCRLITHRLVELPGVWIQTLPCSPPRVRFQHSAGWHAADPPRFYWLGVLAVGGGGQFQTEHMR